MNTKAAKFINLCPVLVSNNIQETVRFYTEKLGFQSAQHYDKVENFATLYRDEIEFVIVQAQKGEVSSNAARHGAGYDAYIDPAELAGVDEIYSEYSAKGVKILFPPKMTEYGSYEFAFEDIDGHQIGVGLIKHRQIFFEHSEIQA